MGVACGRQSAGAREPELPPLKCKRKHFRTNWTFEEPHKVTGICPTQLVPESAVKIKDDLVLEHDNLGAGAWGSVCRASSRVTGTSCAVKKIMACSARGEEVAIMKAMDHPNIVRLYGVYYDVTHVYLAMELCAGGELFDRIVALGKFSEIQAAVLTRQLVRAVVYMHDHGVCHRDLKPENLLLSKKDSIENSVIKVIDFGSACRAGPEYHCLRERVGTPQYAAPEVFKGAYGRQCDMWSCGVIVYILLCGLHPFQARSFSAMIANVRSGTFHLKRKHWAHISSDGKDFVRSLLAPEARERLIAEQALQHGWFENQALPSTSARLCGGVVENLRSFCLQNKLQQVASLIVARHMDEERVQHLREVFDVMDVNGDGLITVDELQQGLHRLDDERRSQPMGWSFHSVPLDGLARDIMRGVDVDGNALINYTEFLAAAMDHNACADEHLFWPAFCVFDKNGDGKISKEEMASTLSERRGRGGAGGDAAAAASAAEENARHIDELFGDGEIDFPEFMVQMRAIGRASPRLGGA
eukprot:TRINITY_DN4289_c0_g1_i7.p1 TRINITY_DN4289_c0_g1~~TRINITY_DN4289_c0_g1_i7.p1  ORF type:complete len:529 (-),score=104.72 TRINITY_DN4289_c0_g1_i7:692-2278(-)